MLHDYNIEISNSNSLKDNTMLNCSMELSLLNNLLRENLITESEYVKRKILKDINFYKFKLLFNEKII